MVPLETFSTAGLAPRRKIEFWNDTACETFSPCLSELADVDSFSGRLTRANVGDLSAAEVFSDAQIVRHSRAHVSRTRCAMFFLHLQLEGESVSRQDGREARLQRGDFTLCDSTRPYEIVFEKPNSMFVLGIPDPLMRRRIACPENIVAIPMSGSVGLSGLASNTLRDFWHRCREEFDPTMAPRVAHVLLDLLASAYSVLPQSESCRSSLASAHRVRIVSYIESHLGDPELTPTQIAEACRMTTRYLHHLFSDDEETVARYILRRRLEECSRALTSASQRGRTVTAIAFDYGFNSPTHFGRVFRARFGVTPLEFRRRQAAAS